MIGHTLLGASLLLSRGHRGSKSASRSGRRDETRTPIALYDPAEHRPLATRFGEDPGVAILHFRSKALWLLGYPEAALADIDQALKDARESGHAVSLLWALTAHSFSSIATAEITRQQMPE